MRFPRTLLLAVLVTTLALPAAVGASTSPPGSGYAWAQPGCAPVTTPYAQPPAGIQITPTVAPPPGSSYAWAQPDCAPGAVPHVQPPAWIPTG